MAKTPYNYDNIYPLILKQTRKWFSTKLNPFNLCPNSLTYWFVVPPYSRIGVSISDIRAISIYWLQQIEPNETSYLSFRLFEFKPPFPLTLLVLFAAFGLTLTDAFYRVTEALQMRHEKKLKEVEGSLDDLSTVSQGLNESIAQAVYQDKQQRLASLLSPFRLTPRLSVFFPVTQYTSIGFLTIDFSHIEYSMAQAIEPNDNIECIFRFFDFYTPFPLQIVTMSLSVGLFITGMIYKYGQSVREEIINNVKQSIKK